MWVVSLGLALAPLREAAGQSPAPTEAQASEAKQLFAKGTDLFLAKKYAEALDALNASYKILPSPNSALMIARCLKALGKPVEAVEMFESVEAEARKRVADGEAKYGRTAGSAAVEGAEIRAMLGSIRIHVDNPGGTTLLVDGAARTVDAAGNTVVWHLPGEGRVTFLRPGAPEEKQVVTIPAGGSVQMEFGSNVPPVVTATPPTLPVTPERPVEASSGMASWAKPAAWVAGGLTVAGFGVFTGFGLASKSEFSDLQKNCPTPPCTNPSDRDEASEGQRNQTLANIGLIVGSVGAAATITFVILSLTSPSPPKPARAATSPRFMLGLGSAGVEVPW